jgi:hypothetical protein
MMIFENHAVGDASVGAQKLSFLNEFACSYGTAKRESSNRPNLFRQWFRL